MPPGSVEIVVIAADNDGAPEHRGSAIVDDKSEKELDINIVVPVEDMTAPTPLDGEPGRCDRQRAALRRAPQQRPEELRGGGGVLLDEQDPLPNFERWITFVHSLAHCGDVTDKGITGVEADRLKGRFFSGEVGMRASIDRQFRPRADKGTVGLGNDGIGSGSL